MEYRAGKLCEDGTTDIPDRFVCLRNERAPISIQDSVHTFHHKFYRKSDISGQVNGLMLYRRKPLIAQALLEYRPNNSGKLPTDHHQELRFSLSISKSQASIAN